MRTSKWLVAAGTLLAGSSAAGGPKLVTGTVESAHGNEVTLRGDKPLSMTSNAQYVETRPITSHDLMVGEKVRALVSPKGSDLQVAAIMAMPPGVDLQPATGVAPENWTGGSGSAVPSGTGSEATHQQGMRSVEGTVASIKSDAITIRNDKNKELRLTLGADSRFLKTKPYFAEDLKPGDKVQALINPNGSKALAIGPMPAPLAEPTGTGSGGAVDPTEKDQSKEEDQSK